jgi:hypothetical protein
MSRTRKSKPAIAASSTTPAVGQVRKQPRRGSPARTREQRELSVVSFQFSVVVFSSQFSDQCRGHPLDLDDLFREFPMVTLREESEV